MNKRNFIKKFQIAIALCLMFTLSHSNAFAWGWPDRHHQRGREVIIVGHDRYYYHDGRFFRRGWFGLEFAVAFPPVGLVIGTLPSGYSTIIIREEPYYYYEGVYYRHCPSGYVVVAKPLVIP